MLEQPKSDGERNWAACVGRNTGKFRLFGDDGKRWYLTRVQRLNPWCRCRKPHCAGEMGTNGCVMENGLSLVGVPCSTLRNVL